MGKFCLFVFSVVTLGISPASAQESVLGRTANPHGDLKIACENCHTTTAWKPLRRQPEFDHNRQTSFALQGLHQDVACQSCHVSLVFSGAPTSCGECHADLHRRQFGADCAKCHSVRGWDVAVSAIQQHNNRFPLLGAHAAATCDQCHVGAATGAFTGLSTECVSCHLKDYQRATPLNHVAAKLPTTCETCHGINVWQGAKFNHNQFTSFQLTGAHATVACTQCHVGNRFAGTPVACYGCHANDFIGTTNPSHVQAAFPQICETCHNTSTWAGSVFDHNKLTAFPLTGMHTSVTCAQCHVGNKFAGTATTCVGCHLQDYAQTNNPNHVAGNFSTSCETCHTTSGWQNAKFDHNLSSFKLTGAHNTVACAQCHINGNFVTAPTACVGCHLTDFQNTTAPNHVAAALPQTCETCHTTAQWMGAKFDHSTTGFTLTGAHTSLQCAQCHNSTFGNYSISSGSCANCHMTDYKGAMNPNHATAGFPTTCDTCHTTVAGWGGASFNHTSTGFTLTGAHTTVQCLQCHTSQFGGYSITNGACWNCHQTDYNNTTNPAHKAANFPQACDTCHSMAPGWGGAAFNHTSTGFALTGAHTSLQCLQCHTSQFGGYSIASGACWNCHQTDFNNTTNPAHKAANFPQACEGCHTTAPGWGGATFNHATTGFALTGAHTSAQCVQCHTSQFGGYSIASGACANCHMADFKGTTNPNHVAAAFPTTCDTCHTTVAGWGGSSFNHATTGFVLTGAHTSLQCLQCHTKQFGGYSIANGACWNCHQTDFNTTTNPAHKAANFPTACEGCHTTVNWGGATFNHTTTGFTLTGAHTTVQCAQCHTSQFGGYNISSGACANCHMADFNRTNNPSHMAAGFPTTCDTCHTTVAGWGGASFNHTSTGFTLTGGHTSLQCQQCHNSTFGNYSITSGACWNCHQTDYKNTNNPSHVAANFPQTCDTCHTTAPGWGGATFNHSTTGFTLTGGHTSLQCNQCHTPAFGNYSIPNGACWNCHQTDYKNTNNPSHVAAGFPQTCDTCHTTAPGWGGATFNHSTTGFTLTGGHTSLQCNQCHTPAFGNYSIPNGACWNCHQTDYNGTTNPAHLAANFPHTCDSCHTTAPGWGGASFNHTSTGFALTNAHATLQCTQCHNPTFGNYSIPNGACWNCHQTDYNGTNNPNHKAANFPQTCDTCHTTIAGWGGATFNHTSTGFTLTGAHTSLQCNQCHTAAFGNYSIPNGACWNCHQTDYNGTTNPAHLAANFPHTCDSCHTTVAGWGGATFNHATTGFTLTGAHNTLQCVQCHNAQFGNYNITSAACGPCHMTDYNGTTNPPHQAAGFPTTCDTCHTTAPGWGGATFNHTSTGFTLTGAHTSLQCNQCHTAAFGNYSIPNGACWNCHQTDYNGTTNPAHLAANFPHTCDSCHTTVAGWGGATFNHATTGFTLTGAHNTLQCVQCHNATFGNYNITSAACGPCHMTDYNGTTNPPHQAAGFPTTCDTCHTTVAGWGGATFNHATTGFTLTGAHTSLQCNQCHTAAFGNYSIPNGACWNCHQTDYNGTTNPAHLAANFPHTCDSCHTTVAGWGGATFNHATTGFTLTGAHTTLACTACHNATFGNYNITSAACANCHMTDYNGTTNPPHAASGFPTTCDSCHTTVAGWGGATFNHPTTPFQLTGYHATMLANNQCTLCHVNNNFSLSYSGCYTCHVADYTGTTNPPHATAGFPQDCSTCHSTTNWTGATFSHPTTPLALTGYHATMLANNQCSLCHVGNSYTNTPSTCVPCHQTDYNNTTNPNHAASAFPTTCNTCHTFTDWTGATFAAHDSSYFKIYSGTHNGKWTTCADCHTNAANYAVFTCIACHQHSNQTSVTSQHSGVKNFVYNATSCYGCHSGV